MDAFALLRQFEGFRETPYWDVNAYRTGYGSDTITRPDGSVVPVAPGMKVGREDAERDLQRRVNTEFMPRAMNAVGQDNWGRLTPAQQAALTSITYNYGSLPKTVAAAVASGDPNAVGQAITALGSHNGGINANRRAQEAAIFMGQPFQGGGELQGTVSTKTPGLLGQPEQPKGLLGMNPERLDRLSLALMALSGSPTLAPLMANVSGRMEDRRDERKTAEQNNVTEGWLRSQPGGSEFASLIPAIGAKGALDVYMKAKSGSGAVEYGLTPQPYVDEDGKLRIGVLGKDGSFKPVDVPGEVARGIEKIDLGDRWRFVNTITGEVIGEQAKNLRDAAAETEIGKATGAAAGEAITGAGGVRTRADQISKQIDSLLADPYLPQMIGPVDSRLPNISGDANRVQSKIDQVLGQAFLEGRQMLKGGGAITDFESKKAEQAFIRANTAQNEADFRAAMTEFRDAVRAGAEKLEASAARAGGAPAPAPTPTADPLGLR